MIITRAQRVGLSVYAGLVLLVFYFPIFCLAAASFSKKRYFSFPYPWADVTTRWYVEAASSAQVAQFVGVSLRIAALTTILSLLIGFFASLAYARYAWRGRRTFQRLVLLPLFFPQSVLGLALLMWFNFLGVKPSWWTAVIAHTVWIAPIATLIMSIRAYGLDPSLEEAARDMGASRWQILRWITIPLMAPGIVSAACFSILLSWGNFALSLFTTGADSSLPEWLYARMTSGYQPIIPAVGTLSVAAAIVVVLAGAAVLGIRRRFAARRLAAAV
ncbi:MAG: ABC transporter permease [Kiritimatiellae bacterium]|nr:ABC transporter permease [Kiritimatiellia bacterium]MDW8458746.1 ABC transporter permease [Verrucomicrobiota bacterium]